MPPILTDPPLPLEPREVVCLSVVVAKLHVMVVVQLLDLRQRNAVPLRRERHQPL